MTRHAAIPMIPLLETLSRGNLTATLQEKGALLEVNEAPWSDRFPSVASCKAFLAASSKYLCIRFEAKEKGLRCVNCEDNLRQWEDSCCEFFVEDGYGRYFNFEVNPAGKVLSASGKSREGRQRLPEDRMKEIIRIPGDLPAVPPFCIEDGSYAWEMTILVPFSLLGMGSVPSSLKANLYKCGDLTAEPHFLSWNRVGTPSPDFHRPEFFGTIEII